MLVMAYCVLSNPEIQKARFSRRVAQAKNQVEKHAAAAEAALSRRPPLPDGNYVATYTIKGKEFCSKITLSFSPNDEDHSDSHKCIWLISGRGKIMNNVNANTASRHQYLK